MSTVNTIIKKNFQNHWNFGQKLYCGRYGNLHRNSLSMHMIPIFPVAVLAYDTVSDCSCYCLVHQLIEDKWRVDASVSLPSLVRLMAWRRLNQWWSIVNFTHGNKLQRNLNRDFHSGKCIWNCRLVNGGRFFSASMYYQIDCTYILVGYFTGTRTIQSWCNYHKIQGDE